jgi:hypothetical protein
MPAIELGRLKIQAAQLANDFTRPAIFASNLEGILDFYADRTHRPGQSGTPHPLLPAFNVPAPVLRQIVIELAPFVGVNPQAGLILADELWKRDNLEYRLLTASLLGLIPVEAAEGVVTRVQAWLVSETEPRLVESLLRLGLAPLRREKAGYYQAMLENWLTSQNLQENDVGLRGILPLIESESFDNLPVVYRLLTPYIRTIPARLRPALLEVLEVLIDRSPQETAYFLRQNLNTSASVDTPWIIRKLMRRFPVEVQDSLRKAMSRGKANI